MNGEFKDLLVRALLKKAKGYIVKEKTDEYIVEDGCKKLVKSKTVTKRAPPDVSACKALLQLDLCDDYTRFTDEQLREEKLRLIRLLAECEESET